LSDAAAMMFALYFFASFCSFGVNLNVSSDFKELLLEFYMRCLYMLLVFVLYANVLKIIEKMRCRCSLQILTLKLILKNDTNLYFKRIMPICSSLLVIVGVQNKFVENRSFYKSPLSVCL
jgi:hypothetical protein